MAKFNSRENLPSFLVIPRMRQMVVRRKLTRRKRRRVLKSSWKKTLTVMKMKMKILNLIGKTRNLIVIPSIMGSDICHKGVCVYKLIRDVWIRDLI